MECFNVCGVSHHASPRIGTMEAFNFDGSHSNKWSALGQQDGCNLEKQTHPSKPAEIGSGAAQLHQKQD